MDKDTIKKRVATYVEAMNAAWEIWNQHGKNPMCFPPTFFGREYRQNDDFDFQIEFGHQPRILIKTNDPDEYVHVDRCYSCGKWKLVCGGTACCEVCDGEIPKEEWDAELALLGKTELETKTRKGTPFAINYKTRTITVFKDIN